ncbi:MAG: hypothetical protein QME25_06225 [Bacteroidota bacterium]|nr:hypothetical protein [Bacteroidota bacterium]
MSIWYPGSGVTYGQYLLANSFVRDVTGQVKQSAQAIQTKISDQTKQLVVSNQELAKTFGVGFDSMNGTLEWGFNRLEYVLQDVNASIESLHADFNYSMGLLLTEVHTQNKLLNSLLDKLDDIHETLENPTLTKAREFYRIGIERCARGLLDKALESFLESEKKNDTDFFTQFIIGKLYLYGVDEDANVLDLNKAKQHLMLAVRYSKAEISIDSSFAKLAAESLLHASIAVYAQLGEEHVIADHIKSKVLLDEAKQLVLDAIKIYPKLTECYYHLAKYAALIGESVLAIQNLEKAIIADRNYAVKVDIDHAFEPVRPHVHALQSKLRDLKKVESQEKIIQADKLIQETSLWNPEESSLKVTFQKCQNDFLNAQNAHKSNTFFGFLDAISFAENAISLVKPIKSKRINELKQEIDSAINHTRSILPKQGVYSEEVDHIIIETHKLISAAEYNLNQTTYDSFKNALSIAKIAELKANSALKLSRDEYEERRRLEELKNFVRRR